MSSLSPTCTKPAPSIIVARRASFSAVSGIQRMTGWSASGKRDDEEDARAEVHRERDHVDEPADDLRVLRATREEPITANVGPPTSAVTRVKMLPCTPTPKTNLANRRGGASSIGKSTATDEQERQEEVAPPHRRRGEAPDQLLRAHLREEKPMPQRARST